MQISEHPSINAYQGIQTGFAGLNENSKKLASPNQLDKTDALIDLKHNETQVEASAKALKASDDRIGTLLDIMA